MRKTELARLAVVLSVALVLLALTPDAPAQVDLSELLGGLGGDEPNQPAEPAEPTEPGEPDTEPAEPEDEQQQAGVEEMWDNLLHFIKVADANTARSYAQALLQSDASPRQIYQLSVDVEYADSMVTLARGTRLEGMQEPIEQLREMIEQGYEQERSDPQEIGRAIEKLQGTMQQYVLARQRLQRSGEYALPQLIQTLSDEDTSHAVRARIVAVLPELGREAVRGLSAALQSDNATVVQYVAAALGRIGYPHAAPRLRETLERDDLPQASRRVVRDALVAVAGRDALDKSPAELYYQFAERYYYDAESLAADPRYDEANVWYWRPDLGLVFQAVPRPIFNEVYAMRYARRALEHDSNYYPAVPLWLAAVVQKEIDLPGGATDPTVGRSDPKASYYVLASSPRYLQSVLSRALDDENAELAFRVIEGLAETAGAGSLVEPVAGGAQPLVQAMGFADREVRFLAALALARALPENEFTGKQIVVTVLNEALRQTGQRRALLVVPDQDLRNRLQDMLRQDYEVVTVPDAAAGVSAATEGAGVDVAVLGSTADVLGFVRTVRQMPAMSGLPVVVAGTTSPIQALARDDQRVVLTTTRPEPSDLQEALDQALQRGAGEPLGSDAAATWAIRSAEAIEQLGRTNNTVFDLQRTESALTAAVGGENAQVQVAAADALAVINTPSAQRAIATLAVEGQDQGVRIGAFNALSASLRKFGNMLRDEQTEAVVDIVTGDGALELRNA
ncbi:MAG: HEAT repeat domain-containing protein, partial [Planctomycetota bacterium]